MANRTIPELTAAGTLAGTEFFHIVDADGNSVKVPLSALKTFINTDPTVVPSSVAWRGARVSLSANQSIPTASFTTASWGVEDLDTDAIWSAGAPTRLTVPSGVTKVRLSATINWVLNSTGIRGISLNKNGAIASGGLAQTIPGGSTGGDGLMSALSGVLEVVAGDYFELRVYQTSGANLEINAVARTWFQMEIVEATI